MVTIIATPGAADANSYLTEAEANAYFDARLPLATPWVPSGATNAAALVMATRVLDSMSVGRRTLVKDLNSGRAFYVVSRLWTGAIASDTQALAWPRSGMFDRHGRAISESVVPSELKDATAELAGQLIMGDTTADNAVSVQGITSVRAGSVSLTFKDAIEAHVLPDAVVNLMPPSWFTNEAVYLATGGPAFEVI